MYNGMLDQVVVENWMKAFAKTFITMKCPIDQQEKTTNYYLTDQANLWWDTQKYRLEE